MNKRIKELAEKAETKEIGYYFFDREKFAELIINDCLCQVDKIRDGLERDGEDQQALGADWAGLAIARHFGLE